MLINQLLETIQMSEKEQEIYLTTLQLRKSSASILAERLDRERTSTYKMMKQMVGKGFLSSTHERGTTFFLPTPWKQLRNQFESKAIHTQKIHNQYDQIQKEFESLEGSYTFHTKIKLLSGIHSLRYANETMIKIIEEESLVYITCIATHTLNILSNADQDTENAFHNFLHQLKKNNVTVSSHLGVGLDMMQSLEHHLTLDRIQDMTFGHDATRIWIVGYNVFVIIHGNDPQVIHIHSPQLTGLLLFVAEQLEKISISNLA